MLAYPGVLLLISSAFCYSKGRGDKNINRTPWIIASIFLAFWGTVFLLMGIGGY